jgi:hypothetical protein
MLTDDMIRELALTGTANAMFSTMGIDSPESCKDLPRFKTWNKQVIYMYNYLGYRDNDWPEDLSGQTWCLGDSFTLGLGQTFDDTWPQLLSQKLDTPVINVSMNGASNDWIARRVAYILETFQPQNILIQWSFLHRRELEDEYLLDEDRAIWFDTHDSKDLENFLKNIDLVESNKGKTNIVHSFIPDFADFNNKDQLHNKVYQYLDKNNVVYFASLKQLDFARDGFHYDVLTADSYAEEYFKKLNILCIN